MRILVTGSAGHLGEALVRTLQQTDTEVVGLDRKGSPFTTLVGSIVERAFVRTSVRNVDAILHTATLHKPHVDTHTRQAFVDTNVTGTLNLLEEAVAAGVGLVFQNPDDQLFAATVAEDVRFGPRNQRLSPVEIDAHADGALAALGIAALAARPIEELSFGEKKRACLAGVLAMHPRVLLLDEPTAGLDPAGEEALVALLERVDATLVVATHAVDIVPRLCARVIVLGHGRVVADGATGDVFARADELRACSLRPPVCA